MNIYTLIFLFFAIATSSFAQFDRINSDPLNLNASFAGYPRVTWKDIKRAWYKEPTVVPMQ